MAQNEMVYMLNAYALGKTILYRPFDSKTWKHCTDKPESWDFEKNCYCVVPHNFKVGDIVRIKNGANIKNYAGGWNELMGNRVGETHKIKRIFSYGDKILACKLENDRIEWTWDFRGLELVEEA